MKASRFLPLFFILSAIGIGAYVMTEHSEFFETEESKARKVAMQTLKNSTNREIERLKKGTADWEEFQRLAQATLSNDSLMNYHDFKPSLSKAAMDKWKFTFNAWCASSDLNTPPFGLFNQLESLVADCGKMPLNNSIIQSHREVMNACSDIFNDGASGHIQQLNKLKGGPYKGPAYQSLQSALEKHGSFLKNNPAFKSLRNATMAQSACHKFFQEQYEELDRVGKYFAGNTHKSLPNGTRPVLDSTCLGISFKIQDFPYYFGRGRNLNYWEQPLW